jgi:large subunit ribosomal protein L21
MFAVVEIKGKQYEVKVNDVLEVDTHHLEENQTFVIDKVLLLQEDESKPALVGMPYLEGKTVEALVLGEMKGDKIRVFKMKSKKRYRRTKGHRTEFTVLQIVKIDGKGGEVEKKSIVRKSAPAPKSSKESQGSQEGSSSKKSCT